MPRDISDNDKLEKNADYLLEIIEREKAEKD